MPNGDSPSRRRLSDAYNYGAPPQPEPRVGPAAGGSGTGGSAGRTRRRILTALSVLAVVAVVAVVGGMVVVNNKFDLIDRLGADTRLTLPMGSPATIWSSARTIATAWIVTIPPQRCFWVAPTPNPAGSVLT